MATELEDPFADVTLPLLLPQTLASLAIPASPSASLRSLLQSMALKESEEAVTQAKEISRNKEGVVDSSQNGDEVRDRTQARRPALGRKKAVFSIKPPMPRKSVANVDTSSQIEHIEDPEEYFLAFEQQENAEKELKKLRGEVSADPFLLSPSRKRRPGISGNRRTSSYRHKFSAGDTAEALRASQEALPDAKTSSPTQASKFSKSNENAMEPRASSAEHPELSKDEGLVEEKEKNSNNLLEHLLSSFKNMNEEQSTTFLRESLQLKNIDVGKINLPQLHTFGTNEVGKLNNMVTEDRSTGDRLLQLSPATDRSSVAASSRLANLVEDPSMVNPSDDAPSGNCHPKEHMTSCTTHIKSGHASKSIAVIDRKFSLADKLRGRASEAHKVSDDSSDSEDEISTSKEFSLTTKQSSSHEIDKMAVQDKHESHMDVGEIDTRLDEVFFEHLDPGFENTIFEHTGFVAERCDDIVADGHASETDIYFTSEGVDLDMQNEGNIVVQDKVAACAGKEELSSTIVKNVTQDGSLSGIEVHATLEGVGATMQHEDTLMVLDEHEAHTEDRDHDTALANNLMDGLSTVGSDVTSRNDETQEARKVATVVKRKAKKQKIGNREQNLYARRKSLAGAGTTWDSGVRKSTRIRSRPLNFWLGERFLYGRIHESLATVIGKKITTPDKDGKGPKLKIESFVPKKYSDLISKVASH